MSTKRSHILKHRCRRVLKAAKLAYTNKTKESITSQKRGSRDFGELLIVFSAKVNSPYFLNLKDQRRCLHRLVSLLSVISKVYERLVNNRLVDHLE